MLALKTVDETLVRKAIAGDRGSAQDLLAAIWPRAFRTSVALCGGDSATAQDALQDACLACLIHLPELRAPDKFVPWFMRILTRSARKELKRSARWRSVSTTHTRPAADDGWTFLKICVLQLPKPLREALVLNTIVGYSSAEVATILGIPAGTVRFRVHRARAQLSTLLFENDRVESRRPGYILTEEFSNG